ncbi:MAG TPA: DNA methyltransferase [Chloroflexia bacterium]|nr:DNA methyltransferase [Chloroflexia bacterium]
MLSATTAALNRNSRLLDWYLMPEAFSAPLVHDAMREFEVAPGDTVLDPFCGTGTTLVAAMLEGRNGLGVEVNPFLCFATGVKTRRDHDLPLLRAHVRHVLAAARVRLDGACDDALTQADVPLPDMPRLERWITRKVACKVALLRVCIEENTTEATRDVPMLALASILRGASNMKLSPHAFGSREVKQDAPVLAMFESRLNKMLDDIEWLAAEERARPLGRAEVVNGDIRSVMGMQHGLLPAKLAICSPPYLNNLDYTMQTRMELFFLGMVGNMEDLKGLRKRMMICDAKATYRDIEDWQRVEEVDSVRHVARLIDDRLGDRGWGWDYGRMTRQYFGGLLRAMESVRPMLAPGAPLVMIVGESAHAGVLVPVPDLAAELGRLAGYTSLQVRPLRTRRSSSHRFSLTESAVVLHRPH